MTDPYSVSCPICLAEPGQRCSNHIRQLESVHWSRHWVARQRKSNRGSSRRERPLAGTGPRGGRARSG
jgi:hypothetical protein